MTNTPLEFQPRLIKHKRTRRRLNCGDIFRLRFPDTKWIFGRIAMTEFSIQKPPADVIAYIFRTVSDDADGSELDLRTSNLAIPPQLVSAGWWTAGEFQYVRSAPVFGPDELLPVHCFWVRWSNQDTYIDEMGNHLDRRYDPCGRAGLPNGELLCRYIYNAIHGLSHDPSPCGR